MQTITVNYKLPYLYPKQKAALFNDSRFSCIEASTKSGKSVGAIVWITDQAVMKGGAGKNCWWIAPIYAQAKIMFNRLKRYLPEGTFTTNESELRITLFNGTDIWFKGADNPDSLYGDDVIAAVIDEASRCKDASFYAVRTTLTKTRGQARFIGNVKGRGNWFYKLCRKAQQNKDPDLVYHTINAYDAVAAGLFPMEEIESAKALLPEHIFNQDYLNIPADDGGNPFGIKAIERNSVEDLSYDEPICWGWDLARSVDFTVGVGLDRMGRVCRLERFQLPWAATKFHIKEATGKTRALIDSTGVGDSIVEDLQRELPNVEGFKFTQQSKQQLMEGLSIAIQQDLIKYPRGDILNELLTFEYKYSQTGVKYTAPTGLHDDCVMALALAVKHFRGEYTPNFYIDIL